MKRLIPLLFCAVVLLTSCNLFPFSDPGIPSEARADLLDLTGTWRVILHYEVLDVAHIENEIIITAMDCIPAKCLLAGFVERERLGTPQRLRFDVAEYYPEANFAKMLYHYETVHGFRRSAYLFFDQFDLTSTPARSMAGHFIVYAEEAPASYFDAEDKAILEAAHKGKGVLAGQLTAWLEE